MPCNKLVRKKRGQLTAMKYYIQAYHEQTLQSQKKFPRKQLLERKPSWQLYWGKPAIYRRNPTFFICGFGKVPKLFYTPSMPKHTMFLVTFCEKSTLFFNLHLFYYQNFQKCRRFSIFYSWICTNFVKSVRFVDICLGCVRQFEQSWRKSVRFVDVFSGYVR